VAQEKRLDLEESKRVFYVACTRAEQVLVLAGSTEPDKEPHEGIAADWVLRASRRAGERLSGLMELSVIGPEDVSGIPAPIEGTVPPRNLLSGEEIARPSAARPPQPGPIPPPREVSYTALALFERCGYRFFAERMLRVGSLELPSPDDPRAFGSALHAALELVARGQVVEADALRRIAAAHRLPEGSSERLAAAVGSVRASEAGPMLELGSPEVPFAVPVAGGVVRGTMDLVARVGEHATVLDYKTGRTWDATGERYAAQAEIYALALLVSGATSVEVRFLHVEAGCEVVGHRFTAADRPRITARVEDAFVRMQDQAFPALTAYDPGLCADCPVSGSLCRVVHPHGGRKAR
jgi:ATP-dependent exoDNAse (exonuclease V) beta subunit